MTRRKNSGTRLGYEDKFHLIPHREEYKPYIRIQDIPSPGCSSRIPGGLMGVKTKRMHQLLSNLEKNYFLILDFSDDVVDIREQFPMCLEETILIAKELGIQHPHMPTTQDPVTMTTDFCVTIKAGGGTSFIARTIKPRDDLAKRRTIEKFAIEEVYWRQLGYSWGIVTENEINRTYCGNLEELRGSYELSDKEAFIDRHEDDIKDLIVAYLRNLMDKGRTVKEIASQFEQDHRLGEGGGISLFKHLVIRKYIRIDLLTPLNVAKPIEVTLLDKGRAAMEEAP